MIENFEWLTFPKYTLFHKLLKWTKKVFNLCVSCTTSTIELNCTPLNNIVLPYRTKKYVQACIWPWSKSPFYAGVKCRVTLMNCAIIALKLSIFFK